MELNQSVSKQDVLKMGRIFCPRCNESKKIIDVSEDAQIIKAECLHFRPLNVPVAGPVGIMNAL